MITTRNAIRQDKAFLWELKVASLRQYIEQVFGWEETVQRDYFEKEFRPEGIRIIQHDGQDIGMYELGERDKDWFLVRLEILPDYQNRGIGTTILKRIVGRVQSTGKPLRLQVFKINPAQRLYERLGFVKTGETENHIQMELRGV